MGVFHSSCFMVFHIRIYLGPAFVVTLLRANAQQIQPGLALALPDERVRMLVL
jgi:hypothetical protein